MDGIRPEAWKACHQALADPNSERAKWELTEFDKQLAREWTRRELSLAASSITLEGILHRRMKECIDKVASRDAAGNTPKSTAPSSSALVNATEGKAVTAEEQGSRRLKEWMQSEFVIGQRKRLEKEREKTGERMEKEMKAASERAESGGRLWRDQGLFNPQSWWKAELESVDKQWRTGIEGGLMHIESDRDELHYDLGVLGGSNEGSSTFMAQVIRQFEHWHSQRENERREMDATITRIADADGGQLDGAYQYPEPNDSPLTQRFVKLDDITPRALANLFSATVYDLSDCEDIVWDDILKSTTHSVVNVDQLSLSPSPKMTTFSTLALTVEKSLRSFNGIRIDGGANKQAILPCFISLHNLLCYPSAPPATQRLHVYLYSSQPHPASDWVWCTINSDTLNQIFLF